MVLKIAPSSLLGRLLLGLALFNRHHPVNTPLSPCKTDLPNMGTQILAEVVPAIAQTIADYIISENNA